MTVDGLISAWVRQIGDVSMFFSWQNVGIVVVEFLPVRCHPFINVVDTQS